MRTIITTEGGAPEWQDFTAWRDAQSGDDPKVRDQPEGHRDPALYLRHDGQAEGRDAVARQLPQSGADRQRGREAGLEQVVDRRRLAGGDADLPYRRLRLGRDGALSRRQGRDRARVRSDQGAGFLRAVRHHKAVHGAGRDAVRGAAAARAAGRFLAAEIHALWRLADSGGAAEGMHRGLQMRLRADVRHDRDHRHHRRPAAGGPCRGTGAHALGRQGAARH